MSPDYSVTDVPDRSVLLLETRPRLGQKCKLFLCRLAPKHCVAMWIAAEAVDDGLMSKFGVVVALRPAHLEQTFSNLVNQCRLAVHVGHVHEGAFIWCESEVRLCSDSLLG